MSVELVSIRVEAVSRVLLSIATPLAGLYLLKVVTVSGKGSEADYKNPSWCRVLT